MNPFDEAIGRFFAWLAQNGGAFFGPFFRGISFLGDYGIRLLGPGDDEHSNPVHRK